MMHGYGEIAKIPVSDTGMGWIQLQMYWICEKKYSFFWLLVRPGHGEDTVWVRLRHEERKKKNFDTWQSSHRRSVVLAAHHYVAGWRLLPRCQSHSLHLLLLLVLMSPYPPSLSSFSSFFFSVSFSYFVHKIFCLLDLVF